MFRGEFVHSIDSKGRVSIPTPFREELQRRSDQPPILTRWSNCLQLYTYEDWCERESQFMEMPNIDPNVEKLRRLVVSGANQSKIDAQGRLLIPPLLALCLPGCSTEANVHLKDGSVVQGEIVGSDHELLELVVEVEPKTPAVPTRSWR